MLKLAEKFADVKVNTKVMLVAEIEGVRTSVYPSGKILLHDCSEEKGQEIAANVYKIIKKMADA